jgi:transcriptional regulator with XRE-family HTH domain
MSQDLRKILATNVKKLREKSNLKKEKLSLLLEFDNSYISKLEKGRVNITIDKIQKIADFFEVNIKDLFWD